MRSRTTGVPLGASHGIGHQLGLLGVGHGETSCIMLPAVCKYNARRGGNVGQQERVLAMLLGTPSVLGALQSLGLEFPGTDLGDFLGAIIEALDLPRTLKEVNVGRDKLELLAQHSLDDPWLKANPATIETTTQVLEILESVVE